MYNLNKNCFILISLIFGSCSIHPFEVTTSLFRFKVELMDFFVAITTKQLKIWLAYRNMPVFGVIKLIS
jgi:hypothetical protein